MQIIKLFRKHKRDHPMMECSTLTLHKGYGIEGDSHAVLGSPRQLLIADQRSLEQFDLQPGDLHENILVNAGVEHLISGQILQIGAALIRPTFPCEPCAKLETIRPGLAKQIKGNRGFLGMVVRGGTIQVGDAIGITSHRLSALPNDAKGRFYEFVARIPVGKLVRTSDLILALGVANAYYRAIPALLKQAPSHLPVHRIVAADGSLFTRHLPDQAIHLANEGIDLTSNRFASYLWSPKHFHDLETFKI